MLEHFTFDRELETARFLLEDFISTNTGVYLSVDGELIDATAQLRGHAVALTLQEELNLTGRERLALCCVHNTGLYRFRMDLVDDAGTILTLVRCIDDPLSRRIAVRGRIEVDVELCPTDSKLGRTRTGRTVDLSRGGMCVVLPDEVPLETDWQIMLHLWEDESLQAVGRIVRKAATDREGFSYGVFFTHIDAAAEQKLLDFVLANADIPTEDSV